MNPATRKHYFRLWATVCAAQGWPPNDNHRRRQVTLYCTTEIGAPPTDSITKLNPHQITALFTYLHFLAGNGASAPTLQWEQCKTDYLTYNHLRQAEHFRKKAGYRQKSKLNHQRFKLHFPAEEIQDHTLTPTEVQHYLITHANRARTRARKQPSHKSHPSPPSPAPAASHSPDPF